jgi:hypothetical protein
MFQGNHEDWIILIPVPRQESPVPVQILCHYDAIIQQPKGEQISKLIKHFSPKGCLCESHSFAKSSICNKQTSQCNICWIIILAGLILVFSFWVVRIFVQTKMSKLNDTNVTETDDVQQSLISLTWYWLSNIPFMEINSKFLVSVDHS